MDEILVIFLQLLLKEIILFEKKFVWLSAKTFFEKKSRNSSKSNFREKIADSSPDQKNTKKKFRVEKKFLISWFGGRKSVCSESWSLSSGFESRPFDFSSAKHLSWITEAWVGFGRDGAVRNGQSE